MYLPQSNTKTLGIEIQKKKIKSKKLNKRKKIKSTKFLPFLYT